MYVVLLPFWEINFIILRSLNQREYNTTNTISTMCAMSDSSEEDLSRFREVVDTSFAEIARVANSGSRRQEPPKPKSSRYLEESSHYNDVKVPEIMQKQIGSKISTIIDKKFEYVDVETKVKKHKIKGGVKLFNSSEGFLSCEEVKDVSTEQHNIQSRTIEKKRRVVDDENLNENDKINAAVIGGEKILTKEDTKLWKSRRKEKLFKYKNQGKSKVLVAID